MTALTPVACDTGLRPFPASSVEDGRARDVFAMRHPTPPRLQIAVSRYRVFAMVVFTCIVALDAWSDLRWSPFVGMYVVGPSSVLVWALTLLGSFGIGPVHKAWKALCARAR